MTRVNLHTMRFETDNAKYRPLSYDFDLRTEPLEEDLEFKLMIDTPDKAGFVVYLRMLNGVVSVRIENWVETDRLLELHRILEEDAATILEIVIAHIRNQLKLAKTMDFHSAEELLSQCQVSNEAG
jgi:hypothetical protein